MNMISSITNRINEANNAIEPGVGERIKIPPSELDALAELRAREYSHRTREEINSKLSEVEARAKDSLKVAVDPQREYGLPLGEACHDIWNLIFEHVADADDVSNLLDTCTLFKDLLERKYKILRLIQVALKFANIFGGFNFLLKFRLVCNSSKAAVDKLFSEDKLHCNPFDAYLDEQWVPKARITFFPVQPGQVGSALKLMDDFNRHKISPHHRYPIKSITVTEIGADVWNNAFVQLHDIINNPAVPDVRATFQRFLGLVGKSIRSFCYISVMNRPATYNLLRSWLTMMPNLEELSVYFYEDLNDPGNLLIPVQDLSPFPSCSRLKRYEHATNGFSIPFLKKVFHANPWISDVHVLYSADMADGEKDIVHFLGLLSSLQIERFSLFGWIAIPPPEFLNFRSEWPLKSLSLVIIGQDPEDRDITSSALFSFINCFRGTLEELDTNWKIIDTGGFLDLPKVSRLRWKLWPSFMTLEFIIGLENLQYLDVDVEACEQINDSFENVESFVDEFSLPHLFPPLIRIRVWRETPGQWLQLWKK